MRLVICYISLIATTFMMIGCGQSGALQLQTDPDYDKRAKYLLHSNIQSKSSHVQKTVVEPAASEVPSN
ncbi:hypothetical protein [Acinetobacter sp. ANC 4648]|uniref:hypothetical protein n=1 Tax=Acinetobacter sp. ANC 4648 TaxID=1977875 RepID=UPI000A3318BC|nr:hypothetical protein [Acinetobacter sp. ANC 4648]OTG83680.1 hypothetical protein B9T27_03980 [Acinetobacter sp. ANC 4648]